MFSHFQLLFIHMGVKVLTEGYFRAEKYKGMSVLIAPKVFSEGSKGANCGVCLFKLTVCIEYKSKLIQSVVASESQTITFLCMLLLIMYTVSFSGECNPFM